MKSAYVSRKRVFGRAHKAWGFKSPLPHSETGRRKPSFFYGGNSMSELPELKFIKSGAPIVQSNCHRQLLKSRLGGKGVKAWRFPAGAGFHLDFVSVQQVPPPAQ